MAISLEYARCTERAMVFAIGDRCAQRLVVVNGDSAALFKIQSTSSKKLRVRPALALLPPHARVDIRIHLSPQEREPSECKLLVLVRAADDADASSGDTVMENELKQRWKRAEQHSGDDSLLFSETISVHIVAAVLSPLPVVAVPPSRVESDSTRSLHVQPAPMMSRGKGPSAVGTDSSLSTSRPIEPTDSLQAEEPTAQRNPIAMHPEHLAQLIVLLMKNQSARAENRLTDAEAAALHRIRAVSTAAQWTLWCEYAYRMRVLVREQHGRQTRAK